MKIRLGSKLILVFAGLLLAFTLGLLLLLPGFAKNYLQELNQKLHFSLAENLVHKERLLSGDTINQAALKSIFDTLMVVNPSIEVYLLDKSGQLLAYSAPEDHIKRHQVDIEPLQRFIAGKSPLPIQGDDPRHPERLKVFTAAPIYNDQNLEGYLYIVLGGEAYDSIRAMLANSYILRITVVMITAIMALTLLVAVLLVRLLTRRLQRLAQHVHTLKAGDLTGDNPPQFVHSPGHDEIDHLARAINAMSAQIHHQISQLKLADASHRELVANVSHDLRTPLASMQGYLETLAIKCQNLLPESCQNYIQVALRHGERLNTLISELFELAILNAQPARVQRECLPLAELIFDVVQKYRLKAEEKQIQLNVAVDTRLHYVSADIAMMEKVMENLIDNAIKYTPGQGAIQVRLYDTEGSVVTEVSDTGDGIPENAQPFIFDRFYRGDHRCKSDIPGSGLGLAIVKRILDLHDSAIKVVSRTGLGSTFSFTLPAHTAPARQPLFGCDTNVTSS